MGCWSDAGCVAVIEVPPWPSPTALVVLYSPALCKHCGDKNGNLPNQSLRRIDVAELDR
jgi:hypothetical protein